MYNKKVLFLGLLAFGVTVLLFTAEDVPKLVQPKKNSSPVPEPHVPNRWPNFPLELYDGSGDRPTRINATCGRFPELSRIEFNNGYWQTLRTPNATFQLLGAYWDDRARNALRPTVRILAMVDRIELAVEPHCQLWFPDGGRLAGGPARLTYMWNKNWDGYRQGIYQPYLVSCAVADLTAGRVPVSVSLVSGPCDDATNNLKVLNSAATPKKGFAVCVKGLDFAEDVSHRLVEWIETVQVLGADKVFFYVLDVVENVEKVLRHYQSLGRADVSPITLPGGLPNLHHLQRSFLRKEVDQKRLNELLVYNDCFYKHMDEYEYIVLLDTDEVIMPARGTWSDLVSLVLGQIEGEKSSFNVRHVYFLDDFLDKHGWFDDIPHYMHMLQHVYRTRNFTEPGYYIKSFHNTEAVLAVHNHFPLLCLEECADYEIDTDYAQLHHYRADCVKGLDACDDLKKHVVEDTTIWRFKAVLTRRVSGTLEALGLL